MSDMFSLKGMNAIITGGGKGLGKGLTRGFLENDANVIITGSSDAIFETEKEFKAEGFEQIHAVHMNAADRASRASALIFSRVSLMAVNPFCDGLPGVRK